MYEDDIDFGVRMRVDLCNFEALDFVEIDRGALVIPPVISLFLGPFSAIQIRFVGTYHACALFSFLLFTSYAAPEPGQGYLYATAAEWGSTAKTSHDSRNTRQ